MTRAAARRWFVAAALMAAPTLAAGCVTPNSLTCSDGRICPPGSSCDPDHHRCVTGAQAAACLGLKDGDGCPAANPSGTCRSGACEQYICGNGILESDEVCDGAPPPGQSCLDYGFDRGLLGCTSRCAPDLDGCSLFAWTTWPTPPPATNVPTAYWNAVLARGDDDVYLFGQAVGIVHWDGRRWSQEAPDIRVNAAWGQSAYGVFAVGNGVMRGIFNGWTTTKMDVDLTGVWASGLDVYAVGSAPTSMLHGDGESWSQVTDPTVLAQGSLSSIWGSGSDDVYAVGTGVIHWDGSSWSKVLSWDTVHFHSVFGSGSTDVFAVGEVADGSPQSIGATAHWDGTQWSLSTSASGRLNAVWAGGPNEVFAAGEGGLFRWNGSWASVPLADAHNRPLITHDLYTAIGGTPGGVFAVGDSTILHWGGSEWSPTASIGKPTAAWASGPDDAYTVSRYEATINHWDGSSWSAAGPPAEGWFDAVWGSGPNDVFVAGSAGGVLHWDGRLWSPMLSGTNQEILSLWGDAPDDVFAVGANDPTQGALVHWDGAAWSALWSQQYDAFVNAVWAEDRKHAFVVGGGSQSLIYRWDGTALNPMDTTDLGPGPLTAVWGSGPIDVFAVGNGGLIAHWNGGAKWTAMPSGTTQNLHAVAGSGPGDVFVGGDGVLLHLRGDVWEPIYVPGLYTVTGLAVTPQRVFVVGDQGEIHLDRASVTCVQPELDCHDGWDNDCDGRADADDSDCADQGGEQCANLIDDDGDGQIDCADSDCARFPSCMKQ